MKAGKKQGSLEHLRRLVTFQLLNFIGKMAVGLGRQEMGKKEKQGGTPWYKP